MFVMSYVYLMCKKVLVIVIRKVLMMYYEGIIELLSNLKFKFKL
jgi:hypothetical protein